MTPILYSFRRCPYAIRARIALANSGVACDLREIVLRDKPAQFLEASKSATVPCLVTDEQTLDESLDIMIWALEQHDPDKWLSMPDEGFEYIRQCDGPFKSALDRTKYATRYPDEDPLQHRDKASAFLFQLENQLTDQLFDRFSLADAAILPFVRQFAFIDKDWFDAQPWPKVKAWLERFLASPQFQHVMTKFDPWSPDQDPVRFPAQFERA